MERGHLRLHHRPPTLVLPIHLLELLRIVLITLQRIDSRHISVLEAHIPAIFHHKLFRHIQAILHKFQRLFMAFRTACLTTLLLIRLPLSSQGSPRVRTQCQHHHHHQGTGTLLAITTRVLAQHIMGSQRVLAHLWDRLTRQIRSDRDTELLRVQV